jgi:excisionase family DNA binding protein
MTTDLLTTQQAGALLGYGARHIVKLYHAGRLEGMQYPRQLLISRASIEAYQAQDARTSGAAPVEAAQPYRRA